MSDPIVRFLPGNGMHYDLPVRYIAADCAKGPDGRCAFCEGDPIAETDAAPQRICDYMAGLFKGEPTTWMRPESCPFCNGRPS